jgi:tRNA pseudouridine38-40 synthase
VRNVKITIQYDGTDYHGWQMQLNGRTIQGELTAALSRIDARHVVIHGAGRTDAGVHAEGQVASFNLAGEIGATELRDAINGNLNRDIRVLSVEFVDSSFHARLSAKRKTYRYRIWNGDVVPPFVYRYVYHYRGSLDIAEMQRAGSFLIGQHDFRAFAGAAADTKNSVRTMARLEVERDGDVISIIAVANGFLRYMVRSIAGTLIEVGRGHRSADIVSSALDQRNRALVGPTAPASGLTLAQVDY